MSQDWHQFSLLMRGVLRYDCGLASTTTLECVLDNLPLVYCSSRRS